MLSNDTNTVGGGLTQTSTLVSRELADSLNDSRVIVRGEVGWSKMLNKVVKDKKTELHSLLDVTAESCVQGVCPKVLNDSGNHTCVSLEKTTHELGSSKLQVVLVVSFLLEQVEILLVKLVVLILNVLVLDVIKLFNSFKGLVDDSE